MENIYMTAFLVAIAHLSEIDKLIALEKYKKFMDRHSEQKNEQQVTELKRK